MFPGAVDMSLFLKSVHFCKDYKPENWTNFQGFSFYLLFKHPIKFYLFKVKNRGFRKKGRKICSKLPIKTPDRVHDVSSGIFIVTFEHVSHLFPVFSSLTLNSEMF